MDFVSSLALIKQAFDAVKQLQEVEKAWDQAALKSALANVMVDLSSVRMALAEARDNAAEKDLEIARLKKDFEARADLIESFDFKYRRSPEHPDQPIGYPVCPRCETVDGRLIFTVKAENRRGASCPECSRQYHVYRRDGKPPATPQQA